MVVAPNGDAVIAGRFGEAFDFDLGLGANVMTAASSERWDGSVGRYASSVHPFGVVTGSLHAPKKIAELGDVVLGPKIN